MAIKSGASGVTMDNDPTTGRDNDLIVGRKGIMHFLQFASWEAVQNRIRNEGLPVQKVAGRIEMSKEKYRVWRDGRKNMPTKNDEPVITENQGECGSVLIDIVREEARKMLRAAIETKVSSLKEIALGKGILTEDCCGKEQIHETPKEG